MTLHEEDKASKPIVGDAAQENEVLLPIVTNKGVPDNE